LRPRRRSIRIGGPTVSDGMASGGGDAGAIRSAPFVLGERPGAGRSGRSGVTVAVDGFAGFGIETEAL
jgi:hypothetical protein